MTREEAEPAGADPLSRAWESQVPATGPQCKLCRKPCAAETAHRHDGGWVGDECCWDERLKSTE